MEYNPRSKNLRVDGRKKSTSTWFDKLVEKKIQSKQTFGFHIGDKR